MIAKKTLETMGPINLDVKFSNFYVAWQDAFEGEIKEDFYVP